MSLHVITHNFIKMIDIKINPVLFKTVSKLSVKKQDLGVIGIALKINDR